MARKSHRKGRSIDTCIDGKRCNTALQNYDSWLTKMILNWQHLQHSRYRLYSMFEEYLISDLSVPKYELRPAYAGVFFGLGLSLTATKQDSVKCS